MSLVHTRPPAGITTVRAAKTGGTPVRDGKGDAVPLRHASPSRVLRGDDHADRWAADTRCVS
jgi:hypothetical protein